MNKFKPEVAGLLSLIITSVAMFGLFVLLEILNLPKTQTKTLSLVGFSACVIMVFSIMIVWSFSFIVLIKLFGSKK